MPRDQWDQWEEEESEQDAPTTVWSGTHQPREKESRRDAPATHLLRNVIFNVFFDPSVE